MTRRTTNLPSTPRSIDLRPRRRSSSITFLMKPSKRHSPPVIRLRCWSRSSKCKGIMPLRNLAVRPRAGLIRQSPVYQKKVCRIPANARNSCWTCAHCYSVEAHSKAPVESAALLREPRGRTGDRTVGVLKAPGVEVGLDANRSHVRDMRTRAMRGFLASPIARDGPNSALNGGSSCEAVVVSRIRRVNK